MKNSYVHGHQQDVLRVHQQRTAENSAAYLIPHLAPGDHVLDIGAGPGTITADFARITGRITATEINVEALSLSQQRFQDQGLTSAAGIDATFSVEDIHELSFPSNTFDAAHAHQVLQHVKDPVKTLKEMARVLKPGGYLAARDADYGGFLWFPESEPVARWNKSYRALARLNGGEPDAGRRLATYAQQAGLTGAQYTTSTWTYTGQNAQWLADSWAQRLEHTTLGEQLVNAQLATAQEVQEMAQQWRNWGNNPEAVFVMLHGEILWQKPAEIA